MENRKLNSVAVTADRQPSALDESENYTHCSLRSAAMFLPLPKPSGAVLPWWYLWLTHTRSAGNFIHRMRPANIRPRDVSLCRSPGPTTLCRVWLTPSLSLATADSKLDPEPGIQHGSCAEGTVAGKVCPWRGTAANARVAIGLKGKCERTTCGGDRRMTRRGLVLTSAFQPVVAVLLSRCVRRDCGWGFLGRRDATKYVGLESSGLHPTKLTRR